MQNDHRKILSRWNIALSRKHKWILQTFELKKVPKLICKQLGEKHQFQGKNVEINNRIFLSTMPQSFEGRSFFHVESVGKEVQYKCLIWVWERLHKL